MKKIIPLIYALSLDELNEKLGKLLPLSDDIQIDIMDGAFVPAYSFDIVDVKELPKGKNYEAHLMVAHPLEYIEQLERLGIKRVVFHDEVDEDTGTDIDGFKSAGFTVFLATNPDSDLSKIEHYIPKLDGVTVMMVPPGKTGQPLEHSAITKIKVLREKYPDLIIETDGGAGRENIKELFESGASIVGIGSGITKADDPAKEWEELKKLI